MGKEIDYEELYKLQDLALEIVFGLENNFYLTGGTALHRFYYNLRYSVDLDFFSSADPLFSENISEILNAFIDREIEHEQLVRARDFQRIMIQGLQLDFVNDRVYREGKSTIVKDMKIDNIMNILTNKIAAIMDRDEEKDIFDLFAIAYNEPFNWNNVLTITEKKAHIDRGFLAERLRIFPVEWLSRIRIIREIKIDKPKLQKMCDDILSGGDNSLYRKTG